MSNQPLLVVVAIACLILGFIAGTAIQYSQFGDKQKTVDTLNAQVAAENFRWDKSYPKIAAILNASNCTISDRGFMPYRDLFAERALIECPTGYRGDDLLERLGFVNITSGPNAGAWGGPSNVWPSADDTKIYAEIITGFRRF